MQNAGQYSFASFLALLICARTPSLPDLPHPSEMTSLQAHCINHWDPAGGECISATAQVLGTVIF